MDGLILAGDVGGTKTQLGLFEHSAGKLLLVREHRYATIDFDSLEAVCADFLGVTPAVNAACLGVPGPIIDGRAHATNVPWQLSAASLSRALNGVPVRLLNDLAAIAAGTGLGESALVWEGDKYYAVASEGGHSDFAPHDAEQIEMLRFLAGEFGHVSYERVLSGPGLWNIYRFLRGESGVEEPAWLKAEITAGDPSAVVSEAAQAGRDPVCVHALTMFCDIYGSEAANLALKVLALGGVFLGGGIAPKILPMLTSGVFVKGFLAKGRLNEILKRIEVRVSLNPAAGLLGAAHYAAAML